MIKNIKGFLKLPSFEREGFVSIDFAGDILQIAYLRQYFNRKEISSLYSFDIRSLSDDDIAKNISAFLEKLKLKNPFVLGVIPSHFAITKNVEIPSVNPKEIRDIIELQGSRHTPYSRSEIVIDYINIGAHHGSYTKILLIIVTRALVKKKLDILAKSGLRTNKVFLSASAVAHFYSTLPRIDTASAPKIILHVNFSFTDFIVAFNNNLIFLRSIPIGRKALMDEKQESQPAFFEEIRKTITLYRDGDIEKMPDEIILTEAPEGMEDLEGSLNSVIPIPTKVLPYFMNTTVSGEAINTIKENKQISFLGAVAPLLTYDSLGVNLIPEEIKLSKSIEERGKDVIKAGIFIMVCLALICGIFLSKIYFKVSHLNHLKTKYQSVNQEAEKLEEGFDRIRIIKSYLYSQGRSLDVIRELYKITPPDVSFSEIGFNSKGDFFVKGTAESMSKVFSFITTMEDSGFFEDVKTSYTNTRKKDNKNLADFKIVCTMEK